MPETAPAPRGAPCWIEIFTSEPGQAEEFYCRLFGWTADHSGGAYLNFYNEGRLVAGCMRNDGRSGVPDNWSVYLRTDDVRATAAAATTHGGTVLVPPSDAAHKGRFAILADAGGAAIGAWQPGSQDGFDIAGAAGEPRRFELLTPDYAASVEFYHNVFGWDTQVAGDADEVRYITPGAGGGTAVAAIRDATNVLPSETRSAWNVYFGVKDCAATIAHARKLGGSIVTPTSESPSGRFAQLADQSGVTFKIVQPT